MPSLLNKSLKKNIILFTMLFTLIVTILIASFSFYTFQSYLKKNMIQQTEFNLLQIVDDITSDINELVYLSKWCGSNRTITTYLEDSSEESVVVSLEAYERLKEEQQNSKISEYIKRIMISNNNGKYIQVLGDVYDFYISDPYEVSKLDFFDFLLNSKSIAWVGIIDDPLIVGNHKKIIPVVRPIYSTYKSSIIGWTYITVSSDIITDQFKNYSIPDDCYLYVTIASNTYQFKNGILSEVPFDYDTFKNISNQAQNENTRVELIKMTGQKNTTLISTPTSKYGWYLSQTLSENQLSEQRSIYYIILFFICLLVIILGALLVSYLNYIINTPIKKIRNKINKISIGDFSYDSSIEWDNEFGEIGKGINTLSFDVSNLMEKRIANEHQKHNLEYQIRLNQINPHFLYNTLNSIKWMATIQNADGIASMVSALASLLRKVSKETRYFISIREELEILNDYFLILKYRYGGNISMNITTQTDDLYDCQILRFSLQPIVENAIFHGIEPQGFGNINIDIKHYGDNDIIITITDDGIGMTDNQIEQTLSGTDASSSAFFQKIGISNVNSRIKYSYGDNYGLSINSEIGKFTKVTIISPYEKINKLESKYD